ncbi:MAG: hypothetical protein M3T96_01515 [Acidobacteriota bacterium]|nr:hypothetical protein [Acidobacteriota bacterium]
MTKNLTAESLNRLLVKLSDDEREAAVAYTNLRASLIRFFELKGDSEPETAADETLDRTALKVTADAPVDNVKNYSFGVARLIFLERRRRSQREKNAAEDFYDGVQTATVETDEVNFFRECFQSLPVADREFMQSYFTDVPYQELTELRRRLTDEAGISLNQVRVKISRLRKRLENCVFAKQKNINSKSEISA